MTLRQAAGKLSEGKLDHRFTVDVIGATGNLTAAHLRWAVCARSNKPLNWSMSLLLNDVRIDCIDWEKRVLDHRGHLCSGWHRHIWDSDTESCEHKKECLDGFGTFVQLTDFFRDGCDLLRIRFGEEDTYATSGLLFA
jgi:hypothetical protein